MEDNENEEEYDVVSDYCADILSLDEFRGILYHLFKKFGKGEWAFVHNLFEELGLSAEDLFRKNSMYGTSALPDDISESLVVCWLDNPQGLEDFATVIFFDYMSMSQSIATYNKSWLIGIYENPKE